MDENKGMASHANSLERLSAYAGKMTGEEETPTVSGPEELGEFIRENCGAGRIVSVIPDIRGAE